jgi:hypothetical protein
MNDTLSICILEGLEMAESSGVEKSCRKVIVKNYVALKKYLNPDPIIDCDTGFELLTVVDRKNIKVRYRIDCRFETSICYILTNILVISFLHYL